MAAQRRRLSEIEAWLSDRLVRVGQEIALARQSALEIEAELVESRTELEAATKRLRLDERGLAQLRRENQANSDELAYYRQRLQQQLAELDLEREKLDECTYKTSSQRRRIAHQLKVQREENRRAYERERAELDARRGEEVADPDGVARQLAETQRRLAETQRRLAEAEERVQTLEQRPPAEPGEDDGQALADMQRRYEMAMADLREQKLRVAELEKRPPAPAHSGPVADTGGKLDWETQKQRLLAALEADDRQDDDVDRRQERTKMRDVISRTDAALAAKDHEIEELQQLLSAQSANIGEVSVGAAAFSEVLSSDEIVRTERERLQQLQREWEEKLRQAEIDLSVQRARIARERAEIEERQRVMQEQQPDEEGGITIDVEKPKPQRGRWLSRLGLKDDEA